MAVAALAACRCSDDGAGGTAPTPTDDRARYGDRAIRVDEVIDGDTAILADGTRVRYIGIDAPEARPMPQCGAVEATAANAARVEDRIVTLRLDPAETRDRFGRLLAYLGDEAGIVNVDLVRAGVACAFPFGDTRLFRDEIAAAEAEARAAGRGVWSGCLPVPEGCPPPIP